MSFVLEIYQAGQELALNREAITEKSFQRYFVKNPELLFCNIDIEKMEDIFFFGYASILSF